MHSSRVMWLLDGKLILKYIAGYFVGTRRNAVGFAYGKLQCCAKEIIVDVESDIVTLRGSPPIHPIKGHAIPDGQSVVLSWSYPHKEPLRDKSGQLYAASDAVEPVGVWGQRSNYVRPSDLSQTHSGHLGERLVLKVLEEEDVRAEASTDYEDVVEKIDLWIFMELVGVWRWVPVDLTKQPQDKFKYHKKLERSKRIGVVVHHYDEDLWWKQSTNAVSKFMEDIRDKARNLEVPMKSRQLVRYRELFLFGIKEGGKEKSEKQTVLR